MEMKNTKKELMDILCSIYMICLLVVLPLYTNGTYYLFGDVKYYLFRNISFICLGIWFVLEGIFLLREKCSVVDICVLSYGACNIVSALLSSVGDIAWAGYADWHMGAITQLLMVGIYFMVSRTYAQDAMIIYMGEAAFLGVTVIALLNRLGLDPLRLYVGFDSKDWEYSHMLSTIGNINWFCGYYSVMLALPMAGYIYSRKKRKQIFLFAVSALGMLLLCVQGSDSGPVLAVVALGIGMIMSVKHPDRFGKVLILAATVILLLPIMGGLITLLDAQAATPIDGDIYTIMCWKGWWLVGAFLCIMCLLFYRVKSHVQKVIAKTIVIMGVLMGVVGVLLPLLKPTSLQEAGWGSGRGALWGLAWKGFVQGDWKQKLIGAGPDCFAEYLLSCGLTPMVEMDGHWSNSIYANAHNEWLTHLINIGILGVLAYLGIFLCGLKRYRGMLLGVLVLAMYGVHSLVSFQQVLNTPFLFWALGLCENQCRKSEAIATEQDTGQIQNS